MNALRKLKANFAMVRSVGTIIADSSLDDVTKAQLFDVNAQQYAEHLSCPLAEANALVTKISKSLDPKEQTRRSKERARHAAERAAAAGRKLQRENDPRKEKEELKEATPAEVAKLVRDAFANRVDEIRKAHPNLSEAQARSRAYAELPGVRKIMVEGTGRRYGDRALTRNLAKQELTSSAQIEAAAKTAEIKKARPELTDAQAYTKAVLETPGLMKRLLDEQRGDA